MTEEEKPKGLNIVQGNELFVMAKLLDALNLRVEMLCSYTERMAGALEWIANSQHFENDGDTKVIQTIPADPNISTERPPEMPPVTNVETVDTSSWVDGKPQGA